jgi:cell division protein ZapA (FtsZ GTPase activity inhibitor)
VVPIAALLVILVLLIMHGLRKTHGFLDEIDREAHKAKGILRQSFDGMRRNLESYVEMLEAANAERRLTDVEKRLFKLLRADLSGAEKVIGRELSDIEKKAHKK